MRKVMKEKEKTTMKTKMTIGVVKVSGITVTMEMVKVMVTGMNHMVMRMSTHLPLKVDGQSLTF